MKLFPQNRNELSQYLEKPILQKNIEFEIIFGKDDRNNPVTKPSFLKLIQECKEQYMFLKETTDLDIRVELGPKQISNVRATISGLDDIKQYCKTDNLDAISNKVFIQKKKYTERGKDTLFPSLKDITNNLRLNLKKEIPLEENDLPVKEFLSDFESKRKHFRYKKRYSYLTNDRLFRIDLSVVKSTEFLKGKYNLQQTFQSSNILKNREVFEVEVEFVGNVDTSNNLSIIDEYYQKRFIEKQIFTIKNKHIYESVLDFNEEVEEPVEESSGIPPIFDSLQESEPVVKESKYSPFVGKYVKIKSEYWKKNPNDELQKLLLNDYKEDIRNGLIEEIIEGEDSLQAKLVFNNQDSLILRVDMLYGINLKKLYKISTIEGGANPLVDVSIQKFDKEDKTILNNVIESIIELGEQHIEFLMMIITGNDSVIPFDEKNKVLRVYKEITNQKTKYFKFAGPQPVTLKKQNLSINDKHSIVFDYAVTEKADGDRYEMIIIDTKSYLINSKQNVIDTGNTLPYYKGVWLFDGEYITKTKDNQPLQLYMIFDVYYNGDQTPKPIHTYPFISREKEIDRYSVLQDCKMKMYETITQTENAIDIEFKKYYMGCEQTIENSTKKKKEKDLLKIFKVSKQILTKSNEDYYSYHIDGLIYLPIRLSVKGSVEGKEMNYIGGTWNYNYKWKPEKENTIDFLVKTQKHMVGTKVEDKILYYESEKYKQLQMIVGYDVQRDTQSETNYCMEILFNKSQEDIENSEVKEIVFSPKDTDSSIGITNIKLKEGRMYCENVNQDEIRDKDIVEMRYNPNGKYGVIWEPLRVRSDKTDPQFFEIANNVWNTIQDPITDDMISGELDLKETNEIVLETGQYYVSLEGETSIELDPLRDFHNYIKTKLIGGVCSTFKKAIKVLDLSCGRGGDIKKILSKETNISFLLGIDISSNIDEACKRFYFNKNKKKTKAVFIRGDTSKNIRSLECSTIEGFESEDRDSQDKLHSETMINIMFGEKGSLSKSKIPKPYQPIFKKYEGIANKGFDIVSSQFSMHYYFKTKETYEGFVQNLVENVSKGGFFIGTCYDGQRIFSIPEKSIQMNDNFGNLIYKIQKKYTIDDFTYDKDDISNMFGNEIEVYMDSIGKDIIEYIVNFDFFVDDMKKNGFTLVNPRMKMKYSNIFKKEYFTNGLGDFGKLIDNIPELSQKDPTLQNFYGDSLTLPDNESLITLSSFNNYFIFQKSK